MMNALYMYQSQETRQNLSMHMIHSVEILQMNVQEISEHIRELALENPMVEMEEDVPEDQQALRLRKQEWLSSLDEQNRIYYAYDWEDSEDTDRMDRISERKAETVSDVLHLQLLSGQYSADEMAVFEYLIASVDRRGYLTMTASHVAETFGLSLREAAFYFDVLRDLEPAGICAPDLRGCLLKQISKRDGEDWDVECQLIEGCLELAAQNKLPAIAKQLGQPLERIVTAMERIRELNPTPAQGFDSGDVVQYVTPDITIVKFAGYFEILLNEYAYPKIHVNKYYLNLLRSGCDEKTTKYLSDKLRQLEETQKAIERRGKTLMRLAVFLLERQEEFFIHGERGISALRMKDAAEALHVHESTISRAVRDKYLQCPWGIYPLNYFFSAGIVNENEKTVSARRIKMEIREMIGTEDKKDPVSDQKLCETLCKMGISVSRRAVAKYRKEMGIGSTRERKIWR